MALKGADGLFGNGSGEISDDGGDAGWITAYCDGGSRGNPGPAGFGVHVEDSGGKTLAELSEFLGKRTNNFAEYSGLLAALNFAIESGHRRLRVVSDSELMVKQIKGQYRVNSPDLKPLYDEAKSRIGRLERFEVRHVLREKNRNADRLANLAMDRGAGGVSVPKGDFRAAVRAVGVAGAGGAVGAGSGISAAKAKPMRGLVKGGVIHLYEASLPDGVWVTVVEDE